MPRCDFLKGNPLANVHKTTGYRHSWQSRRGMFTGYAFDGWRSVQVPYSNKIPKAGDQPWVFGRLRSSAARIWLSHSGPAN